MAYPYNIKCTKEVVIKTPFSSTLDVERLEMPRRIVLGTGCPQIAGDAFGAATATILTLPSR